MEYEEKSVVKVIRKFKKSGVIKIIGNGFLSEKVENKNSDDSLKIRKKANQLFGKKNMMKNCMKKYGNYTPKV